MMALLRRVGEAFGIVANPPEHDEAFERLKDVSHLVSEYRAKADRRDMRTGNPIADMARGTYVPRQKRAKR
jgi:hypothetical protein